VAWRVSGRFQSFIDGVTNITAAFLHEMQDAIADLYGGRRTLVSLDVDGVGDQVSALGAGEIHADGNVSADLSVISNKQVVVSTARSSATPGSGQSVAAGEVWKDSAIFAYCRLKQTGANAVSVTRSLNLASAPTEAVAAKYAFALQTAAPNGLLVLVQVVGAGSFQWTVRPGSLTTSAFEVWTYAGDGTTLTEMSINDEMHVVVIAY